MQCTSGRRLHSLSLSLSLFFFIILGSWLPTLPSLLPFHLIKQGRQQTQTDKTGRQAGGVGAAVAMQEQDIRTVKRKEPAVPMHLVACTGPHLMGGAISFPSFRHNIPTIMASFPHSANA